MARVECLKLSGLVCWFWPNDHRPPHFPAKREGNWEVRVYFLKKRSEMFERVWIARGSRFTETRAIGAAVEEVREKLLVEWEQKVQCD